MKYSEQLFGGVGVGGGRSYNGVGTKGKVLSTDVNLHKFSHKPHAKCLMVNLHEGCANFCEWPYVSSHKV